MKNLQLLIITFLFIISSASFANCISLYNTNKCPTIVPKDGWYFHSHWGIIQNMDSVIAIHSTDGDYVHKAKWIEKSFDDSWYYNIKVEKWSNQTVKGLEWVHHKMYLANTNANIKSLSVSDGYNMLFFNVGKQHKNGNISKFGVGLIVAHPDVELNDRAVLE